MGRAISFPMRLDSSGAVVTMDDGSDRAAAELAGHVVSTIAGERPLGPEYGLPEVSADLVAGAIEWCEPEIRATSVSVVPLGPDRAGIRVDVEWSDL